MHDLAAQAVGLVAALLGVISLQCRSPLALLLFQMAGNVSFVIHYLLLDAYVACVGQGVLILNILVICGSNLSPSSSWLKWRGWKWIFSILSLLACCLIWQDGFSILPCTASLVTVLTNWTFESKTIRLGKLMLSCPAWILYDIHVGSYSGILCESIAMGSALLALIRDTPSSREEFPRNPHRKI